MNPRRLASLVLAGALVIAGPFAAGPAFAQDDEEDDDSVAAPSEEAEEAEEAEEEAAWGFEAGYDYSNIYLFRGVDLLDSAPVDVGHFSASYGGFAAYWYGYFGNFGIEQPGAPNYFENDFGADYTWSLFDEMFSLTAGAVAYTYENDSGLDTFEVYGILGWDVPLQPALSVWYDLDEYDGAYAQLAVSHSFDLGLSEPMALSIDLMAGLGFDHKYNNDDSSGNANDFLVGVDVPWTINDHFSLHAGAQKSYALSSLEKIGQGDEFVYTVGGAFAW